MTDARKNGDLRWLRPDGETQVTIEHVPQVMKEIGEVVRSIQQEHAQQRTVEQIVPVLRVVEETAEAVQTIPQERISKRIVDRIADAPAVVQSQVPTIQTVQKTVEVPQVQFLD